MIWFITFLHLTIMVVVLIVAWTMKLQAAPCKDSLLAANNLLTKEIDSLREEIASLQSDITRFVDENAFLKNETYQLSVKVDQLNKHFRRH